jgi:GxxExxY protein
MDTNTHELILKEEVFQVVGCAMVVELQDRNIPFQQQPRFPVIYKSVNVGEYIPDLIAFDSIIIDTKVIQAIGNNEKAQILNYLKITGLRVGIILNFKHAKLEWQRIVL